MVRYPHFSRLYRVAMIVIFVWLPAHAQPMFEGAPDPKRGVFIRLVDPLDDKRGFCVDIPGHLQGVRLEMALVVHTCKDGFWNYDGRFDEAAWQTDGQLKMPAFERCLTADRTEVGALLHLMACDKSNPRQGWVQEDQQLRLAAHPKLCLTVSDTASEVSRGTRNHPVRHLVRPLSLDACSPQRVALQSWVFTPPSEKPGIRYPDGQIRGQ